MLIEQKAQLRRILLAARDALPAELRANASQLVLEQIAHDAGYREAGTVLAYHGFGSELDTRAFLAATLRQGKILILPRVERAGKVLELYRVDDLSADLEPGPWGIPQPKVSREQRVDLGAIDWALVPGLGFDAQCNRLGYGAGYYDGLFGAAQRNGKLLPRRVSGAFACQVVETIPVCEYDLPVDSLVTESTRFTRK
jgi:5,10-methenyltetrahydrofolate synthetase